MHSKSSRVKYALVLCASLGGCTTAHVGTPLTRTLSGNAPEAQSEFWYQLANQPIASNDDAFHALLLYVDGKDAAQNYLQRVQEMQSRQMLSPNFNGSADEAVDRGTLAVALVRLLDIKGGLTMRLLGPTPRYALRAATERGIFPASSVNQGITGGEFVGVMQKAEEYQHGNPADHPVTDLASTVKAVPAYTSAAAILKSDQPVLPLYLDTTPSTLPAVATALGQVVHLNAIVTRVQGELVQVRSTPTEEWKAARPGMVLHEGTELRTGPKSSIHFVIPADESYCLDSEGSVTLQQAVIDAKKAKTRIDLNRGRLREDLSHTAPVLIEEAGISHDTVIKSPNSALALRGTKVSLFEQPSFDPVAVSLTGQAYFTNTDGLRVPFGGTSHTVITGSQTSPAQEADLRSTSTAEGNLERIEFETRELAIVAQRGGFQRGDVIVGDLSINDFRSANGALNLPGALDFVLTWSGGAAQTLNDLNLAVFSPKDPKVTGNSGDARDYVANPPFTVSLTPNSAASEKLRATTYPRSSRSGGQISSNSVGPDGLELAFWPKGYPIGNYEVNVYNLVDAKTPPASTVDPVDYTVNVYVNGANTERYTGTVGELQTSPPIVFPIGTTATPTSLLAGKVLARTLPSATAISIHSKR